VFSDGEHRCQHIEPLRRRRILELVGRIFQGLRRLAYLRLRAGGE
jgi:hypothetical protein